MKFRIIALLLVLVIFSSVNLVLAEELSVADARVQMREAWNKVKTLSATSRQDNIKDLRVAVDSSTMQGTYFLMKKDGKVLVRQDISNSTSLDYKDHDKSSTVGIESTVISDGEFQYSVSRLDRGTVAKKYKQSPMLCIGGLASMQVFFERYDIRRLPDSTFDGHDVFVFECNAKSKRPRRAIVTVGKKYGILLKRVSYDFQGTLRSTLSYHNIKVNEDIDPEKFVFIPPAGVPMEDFTK